MSGPLVTFDDARLRDAPLAFAEREGPALAGAIRETGMVLLRGVALDTPAAFEGFVRALDGAPLPYRDAHTPRTRLHGNVYTSTEYPASQSIPFHSENSKNRAWPRRLWFQCVVPSRTGGETPLSDNAAVYRTLAPSTRRRFEERGVLYLRSCSDGAGPGVPWPTIFGTRTRAVVEARCRARGLDFTWRADGVLHLRHRGAAVRVHPERGEPLWFNQAHLFHWSGLPDGVREEMLRVLGEDGLPSNAAYGDGTPIEADVIAEIRSAYEAHATERAWLARDVLVVDNLRFAHGRRPYTGERQVRVAMTGFDGDPDAEEDAP
jgi:alpha-ketoglutarate-dependent taurine dioxygenase